MKIVEPQVFVIGESDLNTVGLSELLSSFGTPEWFTDSSNSAEVLVEVAGKLCFDSETEILTKRGWVMFPELNEGEEVFTLNKQTQIEEWQVPSKVHTHDYNDELVCFEGRDLDFKVTKDHRFLAREPDKEWSFYVAGESVESRLEFKVGGCHWDGYFPSQVRLEGCKFLQKQSNHTGNDCGVRWQVTALPKELSQEQMESFAYLIAYFVTEGTINEAGTNKRATIYGTPHVPEIRKLCADLGVTIGTYRDKRNGVERACINSRQIADYLEKYCNHGSSIKKFPRWVLDLPRNVLGKIWSILVATDGHRYENGTEVLVTVSHELAGQAQEILTKIGFHGSISSSIGKNYPVLTVRKKIRDVVQVNNQKSKMYLEKYQGTVHCVTTQNGVVYVRRNGKCHWSGNCYMSFDTSLNENLTATGTRNNFTYIQEGLIGTGHGCYDADTEVLTSDGWKKWPDVSMEDRFATRTDEGVIEYHCPLGLVEAEHKGRMYRVQARGVDLFVTDNHNMLVCPTTTLKGREKNEFRLIKASDLGHRSHAYVKTALWLHEGTPLPLAMLELLGFAIGDGSIRGNLEFHLKKERKIAYLHSLCNQLQLGLKANKGGKYVVKLPNEVKALFAAIYNDDREKVIPEGLIMGSSKQQLEALFCGLMQSDGHHGKTGDCFDTTSQILVGQIQQLCLHIGLAANVCYTIDKDRRPTSFGGRSLTRLSIIRRELTPEVNKYVDGIGKTFWVDDWEGVVYCAEVPNNTLYVRRNGIPVWCGNSVLEHVTVSLVFKDVSRIFCNELVRHRVGAAYCLAGDAVVWSGSQVNGRFDGVRRTWTMRELYEKTLTSHGRSRLKMMKIRCFNGHEFVPAGIKDVTYSGKKSIIKVMLANGRSIRSSIDHRFMGEGGWLSVGEMVVGLKLACNGVQWSHTSEAKEKIRAGKLGVSNPNWKGDEVGRSGGYLRTQKLIEAIECNRCGSTVKLERHHIDRNPTNTSLDNVEVLCSNCHHTEHKQLIGLYPCWSEVISIVEDGYEDTYDLEVDHPSHNFVANGIVTHNSQTSGRYVRNSELNFWVPSCIKEDVELAALFDEAIKHQEDILQRMVDVSGIGRLKGGESFKKKKELTSAFRRIVGNGVATNILATYNHRALRNMIEQRTSRHAEEEIRLVFNKVYSLMESKYPAFYDDATGVDVNGLFEITFKSKKV